MRKTTRHSLFALAAILVLASCDPTKRVPQGRYLLTKNHVVSDIKHPDNGAFQSILKQKPNKKVLGRRLYLSLYNLSDPVKTERRKSEVDSICALKNAAREAKHKPAKTCRKTTRVWMREDVGEPPVILDSALTRRSADQLRLYLMKEGYFHAQVTDTIIIGRGKRASVTYRIKAGQPYLLCQVEWHVDDPSIDRLIRASWDKTLLKTGERFDSDENDGERARITTMLKEHGYLWFTRDMVLYDADTSAGDHQVDLLVRIERPLTRSQRGLKGTREGTPQVFDHVLIDEMRRTTVRNPLPPDTVLLDGYTILYRGKRPEFKPKALLKAIYLLPDSMYKQSDADRTYRRLTSLRVFDRVDITFDSTRANGIGRVDCRIGLLRSKRMNFSTEGFGTNRGGSLGTSINVGFAHKNLFRSMAQLQASITFGLEAQQKLGGSSATSDASTSVGKDVLFNTLSIGPEVSVKLPKPLINFNLRPWRNASSRRTSFTALYNYQRRPDYTRTLSKLTLGQEYVWLHQTWSFDPISINVINIPRKSDAFNNFLHQANDAALTDSYTDHMIIGQRVAFTYNTQDATARRNDWFARVVFDLCGNGLQAFGNKVVNTGTGETYYTVVGIRYAQFAKLDLEGRYHHKIHDKSSIAVRAAIGLGKPYGNLNVLPFESAFFGGGANGVRAWRARTLGPGSYSSATTSFDRIGEMRIEANFEYRFKLIGYLEGALFSDVGNIWLLQPDVARPGGDFKWDRFSSELAVATGVGARFNFDFFIVRFDLGMQTKDPGLPVGQRWLFQKHDVPPTLGSLLTLNLGIGYPF